MPRTLAQVIQPRIRPFTRDKGERYYLEGRVFPQGSTPTRFDAQVRGTRRYDVRLAIADRRLEVSCTCPFFVDHQEPCKHIWATALAADAASINDDALRVPVGVQFERPGADDDHDDDEGDGLPTAPSHTPAAGAAAPRRNPQPPFSPWQRFLVSVAPTPSEPVPARALVTGELIYVFEPGRSRRTGGLLIELMTRDRKKSGEWSKPRPSRSPVPTLRNCPTSATARSCTRWPARVPRTATAVSTGRAHIRTVRCRVPPS